MPWYVVKHEYGEDDPDAKIWTVSRDPENPGWETDGGYEGYGLTKADAEFLVIAANSAETVNIPCTLTQEQIAELQLRWATVNTSTKLVLLLE